MDISPTKAIATADDLAKKLRESNGYEANVPPQAILVLVIFLLFITWLSALIDALRSEFKKETDKLIWIIVLLFFPPSIFFYFFIAPNQKKKK